MKLCVIYDETFAHYYNNTVHLIFTYTRHLDLPCHLHLHHSSPPKLKLLIQSHFWSLFKFFAMMSMNSSNCSTSTNRVSNSENLALHSSTAASGLSHLLRDVPNDFPIRSQSLSFQSFMFTLLSTFPMRKEAQPNLSSRRKARIMWNLGQRSSSEFSSSEFSSKNRSTMVH